MQEDVAVVAFLLFQCRRKYRIKVNDLREIIRSDQWNVSEKQRQIKVY